MAISSAMNIGVQGIQSGMNQLSRTASDVARLNQGESPEQQAERPDLESSTVDQIGAKHLVQSNARTVEVASDTLGTLLDLKA